MCYNLIEIAGVGIYGRKLITGLCNESAIRLCAVDLSERVEGAVKSNSGSRAYRECYSSKKLPDGSFLLQKGKKL